MKIVLTLIIALSILSPLHLGNEYLRSSNFETVTIEHGDTIHKLAEKYTNTEEEKADLIEAICDINGIYAHTTLNAGHKLQIPVLENDNRIIQVAQR